jgi:cytidine deaminase
MSSIEDRARDQAQKALDKAYAPYSKLKVGAALVTQTEQIYSGSNIENVSYGLSICAERVALFKAVSDGQRGFQLLALTADSQQLITPCGACLQCLAEFCDDLKIVIFKDDQVGRTTLKQLLPERFKF